MSQLNTEKLPSLVLPLHYYAKTQPLSPAISDYGRSITYEELRNGVETLADFLRSKGAGRKERVAVFFENSIEAYLSILSITSIGGCYVPLHTSCPANRIRKILLDAKPRIALHSANIPSEIRQIFFDCGCAPVLVKEDVSEFDPADTFSWKTEIHREVVRNYGSVESGETPLYLMYTSGSTGEPKGILVSHENILSFLRWSNSFFAFNRNDRFSAHASISFDLSVFDLFSSLAAGACLFPVSEKGDIAFPGKFIRDNRISVWLSVPSVIENLRRSRQLDHRLLGSIRFAFFAGEALTPALARAWKENCPDSRLYNFYGPTETFICSYQEIRSEQARENSVSVPIGSCPPGTDILILDEKKQLHSRRNEKGEIVVLGKQVCLGYANKNLSAQKRFFQHDGMPAYATGDLGFFDSDGLLRWIGRTDNQIKLAGHRIELEEIETHLASIPGIKRAVAIFADSTIIAYLELTEPEIEIPHSALREHCLERMPDHMIPSHFFYRPALPLNLNGKIDRNLLLEDYLKNRAE